MLFSQSNNIKGQNNIFAIPVQNYHLSVWVSRPRFLFSFLSAFVDFRKTNFTVNYLLKNIKNKYYDIIYIFKNYFVTIFSVSDLNNNKINPNTSRKEAG